MGGASVLPQNLHLGFEVEIAGYMSKIVSNSEVCCDQCIDGSSGPAVVFCCTCCQFLCQLCHDHHKRHRQLSKHNMVGLDQEGAKQLQTTMKPNDQLCSLHNLQAKVYCKTCRCVICSECILDGHKDHSSVPLASAAKSHRDEMEGSMNTTKVVVTKLTGAIDGNDKIIEQMEISKRDAILAINQAFEILQQTLEERKKTLLSEVEAISLSKTTALTLQKEQFEKIVEDIGHYTEVTSYILQTHTDHEVVTLGGLISTELQATLKRLQTMTSLNANLEHSHIAVSVLTDDLVREMSKFGHVSEMSKFGHVSEMSKFGHVSELSPSSSTWTSTSVAKVGTWFHVKVESKTSEGEGYPHGGVQVKGEMRSKVHSGAVLYGEVEDHRDGTYTITLTPQTAGPHQLVITMDGQHVQNSPRDLDVRSKHGYRTLCTAIQVIRCRNPLCVAIHDNGHIYVGSEDNCIYVFDLAGQLINSIGSDGSDDGEFDTPYGISIKGDALYVADYSNHRVQRLTSKGEFFYKFGQKGSGQGQFNGPTAVIVDSNNRLIVSDRGNHRIQIFNEVGGWLLTIDHYIPYPWGLAIDPQGNIHVAVSGQSNITVFTKEGVYVRAYGYPKGPIGIAIDGEGYSFVSERNGKCLSIYDPEGNKIPAVGNSHLDSPRGTALHPTDGSVYVVNYDTWGTVLKYCHVGAQ